MPSPQTSPAPLSRIHQGRTNCWRISVHDTVCEPGFNVRDIDYGADPEAVALLDPDIVVLATQIAESGIRLPGTGAMVGDKFRLTDGHRRRCALLLALRRGLLSPDDPFALFPVLPEPQRHGADRRILDMLVLNTGKPLSILEQGAAFVRLLDAHAEWTESRLADTTGLSITHVRNCVLLKRHAGPALLEALSRGEIAATTAVELIRAIGHDPSAQLDALERARAQAGEGRIRPKDITVGGETLSRTANDTRRRRDEEEGQEEQEGDVEEEEPSGGFVGAEPDTAVTNARGEFISGWEEHSIATPHPKVDLVLLFVEERGAHYYGIRLKWPAQRKGDGYLCEKPQRRPSFPSRDAALLAALQRVHGEMEAREFKGRETVLSAIDDAIAVATGHLPASSSPYPVRSPRWRAIWCDSRSDSQRDNLDPQSATALLQELLQNPDIREIVFTPHSA